jgi:hypothetical protein
MDKPEEEKRLKERLQRMKDAKTPTELAFTIWTKELEEAMGSSRDGYRNPFIAWIECYREGIKPRGWSSYKTPKDLAEGIWQPFLDRKSDGNWFTELRKDLIDWIEEYKKKERE